MDALECILSRRSYRGAYLNDSVPREDLETILQAGLAAPSGCNRQTVSLIAVDDPEILQSLKAIVSPAVGETAPAMICVLTRQIPANGGRIYSKQDYGAAIENMLLAIVALGYESCWVEGKITGEDRLGRKMADILGVPVERPVITETTCLGAAYLGGIALLVAALLFGREVNGAKAWFEFGSLRVQPVEFAKIATALALARVMSEYSFSINRAGDLMKVAVVICIPLFIIILQNDTGSGIVLGSFLFVLYREGLNKWLCIPVLLIAALFIVSFLLSPMTLLVALILVCTLSEAMMNGQWRSRLVFLAAVMLSAILLCLVMALIAPGTLDLYRSLLTTTLAAVVFAAVYAYRSNLANIFITLGLFVGSLVFLPTTDYIFNSILKQHQRDRILSFLGIISDPLGTDYNVNQANNGTNFQ